MNRRVDEAEHVIRTACSHDCPDACALLVTVRNGRAVNVSANPAHPITGRHLCVKVDNYLERVYSPDRLRTPLRRNGPKGTDDFLPISWEEALDTIVSRWQEIAANDGAEAIAPYSYLGSMGVLSGFGTMHAVFHRMGATRLERTICGGQKRGLKELVGSMMTDPEHLEDARMIIAWGMDLISTSVHTWDIVHRAMKRGARLVVIDPFRSRTAAKAHLHVAIYPGTDGALALGMLHVIFREGLEDQDYIRRNTTGVDELRKHVEEWSPERAGHETGLSPAQVIGLARDFATTRPACIRHGVGLQRAAGAGMALRALQCLATVTGQWRYAAGGVADANSLGMLDREALMRADLGSQTVRTLNMIQIGRWLTDSDLRPPIRALYVWNANPAVIAPDQTRVLQGLAREDLFTVVHDQFVTDTARYADIILPATTMLEQEDLLGSWGFNYVALGRRAIDPVAEAKSNSEVARQLAARLGFKEQLFRLGDRELIELALDGSAAERNGATLATLATNGYARVGPRLGQGLFADGQFPTQSGKFEFVSPDLARAGLGGLPAYVRPAEAPATRPDLAQRFPLRLLTLKRHYSINSSYGHLPIFRRAEPQADIEIHPQDARARRISNGDVVRVWNERGSATFRTRITECVMRGTVAAPFGRWLSEGPTVNSLTSDRLGDIGHGPTFCDNLVEVAAIEPGR
jgi:anaerobic selenocysteine-containing dehydrogenase